MPLQIPKHYSRSFRVLKEFDNHEMVIGFTDTELKLKGYIGIHSTALGPALGGTRMRHYESEEEALRDVMNLSRAMSYKCALAGLPLGGGKAVIFADPSMDRKQAIARYAVFVDKLGGIFKTGTDVGISDDDVRHMSRFTAHMLGMTEGDRGDLSTSKVAALGVYYAILSALTFKNGSADLHNTTIGIKGVGKLGAELARLLHNDGATLLIADTNEDAVKNVASKIERVTIVDHTTIHMHAMDLYAPCALGNEFDKNTVSQLQTTLICGGANNQLADPAVGDMLFKAGITYVPDYIANAGGLIYVADELELGGFKKQRVLTRTKAISDTVHEVLLLSKNNNVAPHRVADEIGKKRIEMKATK